MGLQNILGSKTGIKATKKINSMWTGISAFLSFGYNDSVKLTKMCDSGCHYKRLNAYFEHEYIFI